MINRFRSISGCALLSLTSFMLISSCSRSGRNEVSDMPCEYAIIEISACSETAMMPQAKQEDSADDPAFWYNRNNPDSSLIFGTDKKGGIVVMDLTGRLVQYHKVGLPNNVDVRYDFDLGGTKVDLLGFSNREKNTLDVYRIMPEGQISSLVYGSIVPQFSDEVYGFCFYKSPSSGNHYAIINSKAGHIEQYLLESDNNMIRASLVRELKLAGQPEGMVADDELGVLYMGEEDRGIWRCSAEPADTAVPVLIKDATLGVNPCLKDDIEGLAVYYAPQGGYLIASSQGNNSYAVFNRYGDNKYLGSFRIVDGEIDGAEETDGLDVLNLPLGSGFPAGMLIVQDGFNKDSSGTDVPQNFKYVDWRKIADSFEPALMIDTMSHPLLGTGQAN